MIWTRGQSRIVRNSQYWRAGWGPRRAFFVEPGRLRGSAPQQLLHHPRRLVVRQRRLLAVAAVDEPAVVEAKQVEQRRLIVVVIDRVRNGVVAEVVGGAVDVAGLEAAAGEPVREAVGVVIAADAVPPGVVLDHRQPAHLAA